MALPSTLPTNKANNTPQQNDHPAAHNATNQALNDTVDVVRELLSDSAAALSIASAQNVANTTNYNIQWTKGLYHAAWRDNADNSIIRVPRDGTYLISFGFGFDPSGNNSGKRASGKITVSGMGTIGSTEFATANYIAGSVVAAASLSANDGISCQVFHNVGVALALNPDNCTVTIQRLLQA